MACSIPTTHSTVVKRVIQHNMWMIRTIGASNKLDGLEGLGLDATRATSGVKPILTYSILK